MSNTEYIEMIDRTNKWYKDQLKKDNYILFQGEENQMNYETPWHRGHWLSIMRNRLEKGQVLKPHQRSKIERMHEFGPVKWPQSRIKQRYLKSNEQLIEAA